MQLHNILVKGLSITAGIRSRPKPCLTEWVVASEKEHPLITTNPSERTMDRYASRKNTPEMRVDESY